MHLQPHMYFMLSLLGALLSGCAIHYYDSDTQTEHVWGVGHMMLKASVPKEGLKATVRGTVLSGVSIGLADQGGYLTLGYEKRQLMEIIDKDTAVRLEWPRGDLLNLRVGSEWPTEILSNGPDQKGVER